MRVCLWEGIYGTAAVLCARLRKHVRPSPAKEKPFFSPVAGSVVCLHGVVFRPAAPAWRLCHTEAVCCVVVVVGL